MLLLQPRALLAQLVDHAVVHAHQPVHLRLAHLDELAGEVALADELGAGVDQVERNPEALDQAQANQEGRQEEQVEPQEVLPGLYQQVSGRGACEVYADEVAGELGTQTHGVSPCFSKRR